MSDMSQPIDILGGVRSFRFFNRVVAVQARWARDWHWSWRVRPFKDKGGDLRHVDFFAVGTVLSPGEPMLLRIVLGPVLIAFGAPSIDGYDRSLGETKNYAPTHGVVVSPTTEGEDENE